MLSCHLDRDCSPASSVLVRHPGNGTCEFFNAHMGKAFPKATEQDRDAVDIMTPEGQWGIVDTAVSVFLLIQISHF